MEPLCNMPTGDPKKSCHVALLRSNDRTSVTNQGPHRPRAAAPQLLPLLCSAAALVEKRLAAADPLSLSPSLPLEARFFLESKKSR